MLHLSMPLEKILKVSYSMTFAYSSILQLQTDKKSATSSFLIQQFHWSNMHSYNAETRNHRGFQGRNGFSQKKLPLSEHVLSVENKPTKACIIKEKVRN